MPIRFLHLCFDDSSLKWLRQFYDNLYVAGFPDANERESLVNMENYLRLKEAGWYGQNSYHIVLATDEQGAVTGGLVADYLATANVGIIEFLVVEPAARGQGLGRRLLEEVTRSFQDDCRKAGHSALNGICGEVNDPYRRCDVEDNLDGFARFRLWHRLGFHLLDFPYLQPALGPGLETVHGLGLMFRPLREAYEIGLPSPMVESIVRDFQVWAMRISDPEEEPAFVSMQKHLHARETVPLLDMLTYITEEPQSAFHLVDIAQDDARFGDFARLYQEEFSHDTTAEDISVFVGGSRICVDARIPHRYWLCGIEAPGQPGFGGFASAFALPHCGFGGYLALCGHLRGRGLFKRLLRMLERRMVESNAQAEGWYVECEPGSRESFVFRHCGFFKLPMTYLQPRLLSDSSGVSEDTCLELLYKSFGRTYAAPKLTVAHLRRDIGELIGVVYGLDAAATAAHLKKMIWPAGNWVDFD